MEDNNTSVFCSRAVVGWPGVFSEHSYGGAIDINPLFNPCIKGAVIYPAQGASFVDRNQNLPGMIHENDACYQAFTKRGFRWGGHWHSLKDYQHFEKPRDSFLPKN